MFARYAIVLTATMASWAGPAVECDPEVALSSGKEFVSESDVTSALVVIDSYLQACTTESTRLDELSFLRGEILTDLDRHTEALADYETAVRIARKQPKTDYEKIGNYLQQLGGGYSNLGRYEEGSTALKDAIKILLEHSPESEFLVYASSKLGINLNEQGKYKEAGIAHTNAVEYAKRVFGEEHPDYAIVLSNQAVNFSKQSEYGLSEGSYREALSIFEKHPLSRQSNIVITSNNLATVLTEQGKFKEAQLFLESAIEVQRLYMPGDSTDLAIAIYNLAKNYQSQYNHLRSKDLYIQATEMMERVLGPDHLYVGITKQGMAGSLRQQGRIKESIELNKRAYLIFKDKVDPDSNRMADHFSLLAQDAITEKRYANAEEYFTEVIRIYTLNRGKDSDAVGRALATYADFLDGQQRYDESENLHKEAVNIASKSSYAAAQLPVRLTGLSRHYLQRGLIDLALKNAKRAFRLVENNAEVDQGSLASEAAANLATVYYANGNAQAALDYAEVANNEFEDFLLRNNAADPHTLAEQYEKQKEHYTKQAVWLFALGLSGQSEKAEKAFEIAQLASISSVSFAIRRNNIRKSAGQNDQLIRQHQDLVEERRLLQKQLDNLSLRSSEGINETAKRRIQRRRQTIELLISRVGAQIATDSPEYARDIVPIAYSTSEVREKLGKDTTLITFLVTNNEVLVWSVKDDNFLYYKTELSRDVLEEQINLLRRASQDYLAGLSNYPFKVAHKLFAELIKPTLDEFGSSGEIVIVPHGELHSLSFQSLVVSPPDPSNERPRWFIEHTPISILPSVSSLFNLQSKSEQGLFRSFLGVGNPDLKGKLDVSSLSTRRRGLDASEVFDLPSLPESGMELKRMASFFETDRTTLLLGIEAVDKNVMSLDLQDVDLISFATHAITADLGYGIEEAGLVMSGLGSSKVDDWLLTSSEIRRLKISARLVVLSACNTASIGSKGQSAYAGLSESFFYAGANSLVVSQWPVASSATVEITTNMLSKYQELENISMAKALQLSMLSMLNSRKNRVLHHPFFWAPFVFVGIN